jgi:hypothetical protein
MGSPLRESNWRNGWTIRLTVGSMKRAKDRISKDMGSKNPTNWRLKREETRRKKRR